MAHPRFAAIFFVTVAALLCRVGPSSALDVKIQKAKRAGDITSLSATTAEDPTWNQVTLWWCSRAPQLPGQGSFKLELATDVETYSCTYREEDSVPMACACLPGEIPELPPGTLLYMALGPSRQGLAVTIRIGGADDMTAGGAYQLAGSIQKELLAVPAYRSDRWTFLFDRTADIKSGNDSSVGYVVLNGSGYVMSQEGIWAQPPEKPRRPTSADIDGSWANKDIFCAVVRLQDSGLGEEEAKKMVAERYHLTMDTLASYILGTIREDHVVSVDKYCYGR